MSALPTGTVTFFFTDIEGSTKLWEGFPAAMPAALEWHDALLRDTIERHHGHIFKTVGDGVYAAFAHSGDALQAAQEAQRLLHSEEHEFGMLRVRMALLTGEASRRDNDYFGPVINRTARLCAVAHGGQVVVAQTTAQLLQDRASVLPVGSALRDLGLHRLKDLRDAEHVFQLVCLDLPADFPPLRSLNLFVHNLPSQLSTLIGRGEAVADVFRLLTGREIKRKTEAENSGKAGEKGSQGEAADNSGASPEGGTQAALDNRQSAIASVRLLTLTGTGGCGKTRLALQVAAEALDQFPDGVWFVDLAPLTDARLLSQTVAQTLQMGVEQAARPALDTLVEALKSKALLLTLDNCEHVIEESARLAESVLRHCPRVQILATSRENLGIRGETTYRVAPLTVPDGKEALSPESLLQYGAARLFVERAQAAVSTWQLTASNAPAVAQICRQLDGIPLALELAARRVKGMTAETIALQLTDSLTLLRSGNRTDHPRQQTLEAAITWSYVLLSDSERLLLRRLAVFAGGFTLDAAETVCSDRLQVFDILDLLLRLVDKSLVAFEEARDGGGRYRLLETIRQYGLNRLSEAEELDNLRERHIAWCLELAEQAEPQLKGPEQAQWLHLLEREHDNMRAALKWSIDSATRLRLASALQRFWSIRGYLSEGRSWLEGALKRGGVIEERLHAKGLNAAGILAWRQGDYAAAQTLHDACLVLREKMGDRQGVAATLNNLALVAQLKGDQVTMRARLEQSLAIYHELKDMPRLATVLTNLGSIAFEQQDYVMGSAYFKESLLLMRKLGDEGGAAMTLFNLAEVARRQQNYEEAIPLYEQSLAIHHSLNDKDGIFRVFEGLGMVALHHDDHVRAARLFGAAECLRESLGALPTPNECQEYAKSYALLSATLGEDILQSVWTEGRAMSVEQGAAFALSQKKA